MDAKEALRIINGETVISGDGTPTGTADMNRPSQWHVAWSIAREALRQKVARDTPPAPPFDLRELEQGLRAIGEGCERRHQAIDALHCKAAADLVAFLGKFWHRRECLCEFCGGLYRIVRRAP